MYIYIDKTPALLGTKLVLHPPAQVKITNAPVCCEWLSCNASPLRFRVIISALALNGKLWGLSVLSIRIQFIIVSLLQPSEDGLLTTVSKQEALMLYQSTGWWNPKQVKWFLVLPLTNQIRSCYFFCSFYQSHVLCYLYQSSLTFHLVKIGWRVFTGNFLKHFPYWNDHTGLACSVSNSYPTLWDPIDYRLPGSSVHGIFQSRILQ